MSHEHGVWVLTDTRYLGQRMPGALVAELGGDECRPVHVVRADQLVSEVGHSDPGFAPRPGDLVVARTRNRFALTLLSRTEQRGVTCCNTWQSIEAVRDKPRAALALSAAGVPLPPTFLAHEPRQLAGLPAGAWPLLLKPHLGDNALGIVKVDSPQDLNQLDWGDQMVLAQHYVDVAGVDVKVYGIGDDVWVVRRPSPLLAASAPYPAEPLPVTADLRALAITCRDIFGLQLYGVDVLPSSTGPLVVDVNDFPNYTGIPEAPQAAARLVRELLGEQVSA